MVLHSSTVLSGFFALFFLLRGGFMWVKINKITPDISVFGDKWLLRGMFPSYSSQARSIRKYEFWVCMGAQTIAGVLPYIFLIPVFEYVLSNNSYYLTLPYPILLSFFP